jgi:CheY-like chemotaxis protein
MEANRSTEGAGLGMSITKNLVEMMDGSIHVESEPGKGSVFTVYFPQVKLGDEVLSEEVINNLQQYSSVNMSQSKRIQITHEPMPYGSVLIVDDTETNIFVASGLMEPYRLKVDSSDSGFSAVDKVKSGIIYDIIFMDHMMPEMDGMEATTLIREMGYTAPIVALTANAVAGQAEIFLANGFDAFISKPIDTRALDNVLCELIRDKQTPDVLEAARKQYIDGYGDADSSDSDSSNADSGDSDSVAQTSAPTEPAISPQYAKVIIRDAAKAIESLQLVHDKRETPDLCSEEEIRMLTINVHAMKSVMANIGESSISEMAFRMEKAGNQGDINAILADTEVLINDIKAVIERIKPEEDEAVEEVSQEDMEFLREKLTAIKDACDFYDAKTAKNEIAALKEKKWPQATNDIIESITEHLLHGDYEEAATTAGEYIT